MAEFDVPIPELLPESSLLRELELARQDAMRREQNQALAWWRALRRSTTITPTDPALWGPAPPPPPGVLPEQPHDAVYLKIRLMGW